MIRKFIDYIRYMFLDAIMIAATFIFSLFILNQLGVEITANKYFTSVPVVILFKIGVFFVFKIYKILPKYFGFEDVLSLALLSFTTSLMVVLYLTFSEDNFINRSSFFFIVPIEIIALTVPRLVYRLVGFFQTTNSWYRAIGKRTLIIGAGQAAELVIKEIYKNKSLSLLPIGILDDNEDKLDSRLLGVKVLAKTDELVPIIEKYNIEEIIIAINNYPYHKIKAIYEQTKLLNVRILKLDGISEAIKKPLIGNLQIEDLLNREPITLDNSGIEDILKDEVVLITGGGGSIGSELVRQVAHYIPKTLIIFDIYENNAYDIQMDILRQYQKEDIPVPFNFHVIIGSVYNRDRLEQVFKTYKPTIIFHAAAYKHVPLMEDSYAEAIRTNVIGTYNLVTLADQYKAKRMTIVSTDKAVRSTNVMGATKRLAEKIMQTYKPKSKILYGAVRFGNVLNSNGSVIPLFLKQIEDGGPVNVTHKEITRYFMLIPEAVSLILQSMLYMKGSDIFILDMGEPVKIYELAENMIRLMGLRPHEDIQIKVVGLRPGEKLYEELLIDANVHGKTSNKKIFIETKAADDMVFDIKEIPNLDTSSKSDIINYLKDKVTSFYAKD
jgi:FlaA1/EpsC-like NDP-sugar epimerase